MRSAVATTFSALATVSASGFSTKTCAPGFHRLDREIRVGVGQRVDRHDVRLQFRQSLVEVVELLGAGEGRRQRAARDAPLAHAGHLEAGDARVGERVAHSHVAEADDENALGHLFDPPLSCLVDDPNDLARAGRFFRGERSLERRGGVLRPADRRRLPFQRARREISKLLAQRAAAHALEFRPVGGVRAVKLVARDDAEIRERVLDMNDAGGRR